MIPGEGDKISIPYNTQKDKKEPSSRIEQGSTIRS